MLGFSWKQWLHGFTGYSRWWCRTSLADRRELMKSARYGIDDSLMVFYTVGEYDPQSRHIALEIGEGHGHYNWCWPERVAEPSDDGSVERALELVKSKYAAPQRVPAPGGGYWESLSWVPGEVDNMCGKMAENCDLADRTGSLGRLAEVKRAMYLQALAYIETKDPVK